MVDKRTNFTREIINLLQETYGDQIRIFKSEIPISIRAVEASADGKSIFEYDPKGKVAIAYDAFAKEVTENEGPKQKNRPDPVR